MKPLEREVECTIPILPVRDLDQSLPFYTQILGFKLDWRSGEVCSVSCDGRPIMLRQSPTNASPSWVWIGVESDALFHLYRERGVKILQEPMNWSWAYEMKFEDPDGNVLWMGTEPRNDLPMNDHA
jgi:predicted lactoylglutathione lyase